MIPLNLITDITVSKKVNKLVLRDKRREKNKIESCRYNRRGDLTRSDAIRIMMYLM